MEQLPKRSQDFSGWYNELVQKAELADYSPVRGCMVIRPYGFELWEAVKEGLDRRFKATGHRNAYFPLFIPLSFIQKEAKHVEGFAPQLAVVTHGGGKELEEPLAVRPTSETVIGHMYAQWISSYRDLPLLINQWVNVVRWEMRTRLFLRTMEFLWQEGHTAHATYEEAEEETLLILHQAYTDFAVNDAAIPVIPGLKSEHERFAGALHSYSIEAMMGDRRALQTGTSHNLGQNFARAFEIRYLDRSNELQYCWTTSWGVSSRMVGAIIMVHGDDRGLRLPPRLAPLQVVIVPIWRNEEQRGQVMGAVEPLLRELAEAGLRAHVDLREGQTPGFKFNDWEMRGVPLRLEVGPKEAASGELTVARRDKPVGEARVKIRRAGIAAALGDLLDEVQRSLLEQATAFRDENIHQVSGWETFREVVADAWALSPWCGRTECELEIASETGASLRCIPLEKAETSAPCVHCGQPGEKLAYFAKAY